MNETIITLEDAAGCLPELVERVNATGQPMLLVKSGQGIARIVPVPPLANSESLLAFLQRWRIEHPERDEGFAEAIEASRKNIQLPVDPWA